MKDQARKYFLNLWYNSFPLFLEKYPNSIYYVYNQKIGLRRKLCLIKSEEFTYTKDELMNGGELIFEYSIKIKWFWCSDKKIWVYFRSEFGYNYEQTEILIKSILNDDFKMCLLSTVKHYPDWFKLLDDDSKMCGSAPQIMEERRILKLDADLKQYGII